MNKVVGMQTFSQLVQRFKCFRNFARGLSLRAQIVMKPKGYEITTEKDYRCKCGKPGFVDIGKGRENRFPCKECYKKLYERTEQ